MYTPRFQTKKAQKPYRLGRHRRSYQYSLYKGVLPTGGASYRQETTMSMWTVTPRGVEAVECQDLR